MRYALLSRSGLAFAFLALVQEAAFAERYVFNMRRTEVRFTFVMGATTQQGRFDSIDGVLDFNEVAIEQSSVFARIQTASVNTGQPMIDAELKGERFFNVAAAPELTFRSTTVARKSDDSAEITGDLTINGITHAVPLAVTLTPHDDPSIKHSPGSRRFLAKTTISRAAFNMTAYADMVGDAISIEIDAVVRPQR